MDKTVLNLRGPYALIALAVIGGVAFFRYQATQRTLDTEGRAAVKEILRARYARLYLGELDEARRAGDYRATRQKAQEMTGALQRISITGLTAKGRGRRVWIRAEISVQGQPPPDGEPVRYYIFTYSMLTGWLLERETSWLGYTLCLR